MSIPSISSYPLKNALTTCEQIVDWTVIPDSCVLLIHDMQQYFVDFYDINADPMQSVILHTQQLIAAARTRGIPVVYTAQPKNQSPNERALLSDFWGKGLQDKHQSDHIIKELEPQDGDKIYTKWRYSAFQKSSLDEDLKAQNKHQIVVCGIYAHIGILSTALEGFMRDYQCFVVEDAIADFSITDHQFARKYIASRCGQLIDTQAFTHICQSPDSGHSINQSIAQDNTTDLIGQLVSDILSMPLADIHEEDDLSDWGLDSMRLMSIIDVLKSNKPGLDFIAFAENPTLKHWRQIYTSA